VSDADFFHDLYILRFRCIGLFTCLSTIQRFELKHSYADVMAMALSKVGWPAYPDNLQSIPIPDAIQAVTGFECAEKYNRPKHSDLKVQEIAKWLNDHKWSRGKTDSITIPVIFQTLKEGTTTLKPNYAYAVRSFFPPAS